MKTVKIPGTASKLRNARQGRRTIVRAAGKSAEKSAGGRAIDMTVALGADFGCVNSGSALPIRERLKSFGRAQPR